MTEHVDPSRTDGIPTTEFPVDSVTAAETLDDSTLSHVPAAPGDSAPAVDSAPVAASENPDIDELRAEIERTRSDLADTVDQIAGKLDVKAQAGQAARHAADSVSETVHSAADRAKQALPESAQQKLDQAAGGVQRVATSPRVQNNRTQIAIGAAAFAFVLWLTRRVRSN